LEYRSISIAKEMQRYIIKPALDVVGLGSKSAEVLLTGTLLAESGGQYLKQINAPLIGGQGFYQIEPQTHRDIKRWLNNYINKTLLDKILSACYISILPTDDEVLVYNLRYATLMARLVYYRSPKPLPPENDAAAMAEYHKSVYNTALGKADAEKNTLLFQRVINGEI
jgi:hypothetical protein